ncbi:MAG: NAD-dependent epimerase/dehydratase family protein [Gammaproteobacteria bacterium]
MKVLVAGAGGFIGGHLVKRLLGEGHELVAADKKPLSDWYQIFDEASNLQLDLSIPENCDDATSDCDWVFNLAADMGGMGFIENHKAMCMLSVLINTNLLLAAKNKKVSRYFFASSACVYASWHQTSTQVTQLKEEDAYPADPEDGYGWEKLFSERMCRHFSEDFGLDVRIARYHNVYGPHGTFDGGREKAPAAACRKTIEYSRQGEIPIEIWGDGLQLRSFTYIEDCVDGTLKLMRSSFDEPLNIGSSQTITIQKLYDVAGEIMAGDIPKFSYNLDAPLGVRGRSSDNTLCLKVLGWEPKISIEEGMRSTYAWIQDELNGKRS